MVRHIKILAHHLYEIFDEKQQFEQQDEYENMKIKEGEDLRKFAGRMRIQYREAYQPNHEKLKEEQEEKLRYDFVDSVVPSLPTA